MAKKVAKRVTTETVDEDGVRKTVVKEHPIEEVVKKKKAPAKRKKAPAKRKKAPAKPKFTAKEREDLLIENFVGLQHAMTNMSIKFGALSDNISKLLQIFEESAKNFMSGGKPDDKEMLEKIDSLLNQNKTIAKGLVLMEGKLRGRSEGISPPMMPLSRIASPSPSPMQQPAPSRIPPKPLPGI